MAISDNNIGFKIQLYPTKDQINILDRDYNAALNLALYPSL